MTAANPITPAVLAHLPVLEFLDTNGPSTAAQIAAATDRVYSNVKRDMPKLVAAALLSQHGEAAATAVFTLSIDGKSALAAMARARGEETGGVPFALASELIRNPKQPRQKFEQEALERLADTIEEKGILQPLVVRPVGEDGLRVISAGERRWRAAQIVNERKGDPAAVRLPYIERDATPEEQAEEEAYAAYIAVVENGQREPLTTYEEALAYRAMIPALYPSARACGKATGVDGKTVSDRLKALEVLNPAQQIQWRDGDLTWREVRDIFRPPAPAEVDPNQMDLEELTGGEAWKPGEDHAAWVRRSIRAALPQLNPRQLVALVELADACRLRPTGHTGRETQVWPDEKSILYQLLTPAGLSIGSRGTEPKIALMHPDAWEWLRDNGLLTTDKTRWEVLHRVRSAVSAAAVYKCAETGGYLTPALNDPATAEAGPAREAPSEEPTVTAREYDPELLLIVAEAYDRYLVNEGCHPHRARWVKMTDSYPSIMGPRLVRQGLGAIHTEPQHAPNAHLVTTWLEISGKAIEILKERGIDQNLNKARALIDRPPLPVGACGRDRYSTKWLKWPEVDRITAAAEETAPPSQAPEVASAAQSINLTPRQRLVLVEATHKMVVDNALTAGRATRVGAYWLDAACGELTAAKLLKFVNSGGESGWHVMWGDMSYGWFRAHLPEAFTAQGDLEVSELLLEDARAQAGESLRPGGYTTAFLNVEPLAPEPSAVAEDPEAEAEAALADQDMNDDEDAFDELLTRLREEMGRTHGQPEHWTRQSAPELAAKAFQEILRGDALSAIAALVGVLEHSGDTVETARLLHAAGKGDYRPEGKEPHAMLWHAANAVRDLMLKHYEVFNGLPDADFVYRDLSGALNDVSRAKRQADDVLLVIRKGDVVEKHPGAATQHRILEAQGAIGGRVLFKAQPMRGGKDFGSPGSLPLSDFANFIRGGGR